MRVLPQITFGAYRVVLQAVLLFCMDVLPFLNVQSNGNSTGGNSAQFQCLSSVGKCLSSCAWQNSDDQEYSYHKLMTNMLQEHKSQLVSEIRAKYGNLEDRLGEFASSHLEVLQHIKDFNVTLQSYQEYNNKALWDLAEVIGTLKNNLEVMMTAQKRVERSVLAENELSECKENLTNAQKDMNGLRDMVRDRYPESDVVNAARRNDLDQVRLLLDAGLQVDSQDRARYSNTALHVAAGKGYLQLIKFLVERGAPLEARNTDNNTPLIDAASGGSLPAVKLLIELGANPLVKGWHGETPRDRATRDGKMEVVNWLRDNGW